LNSIPNVKIEYCAIVNQEDLGEWSNSLSSKAPVAIIAIQLPSVRLIDNMILE
jgi:pantothenate synthetase